MILKCFSDPQKVIPATLKNEDQKTWLTFDLKGHPDLEKILFPSTDSPKRKLGLWEETCFELFYSDPREEGYFEYNLSPAGDWNYFQLKEYRGEKHFHEVLAPEISFDQEKLIVELSLLDLQNIKIQLSCVLRLCDQSLQYYALSHPKESPDFHNMEHFQKVEL